jgi:hypothetical protein
VCVGGGGVGGWRGVWGVCGWGWGLPACPVCKWVRKRWPTHRRAAATLVCTLRMFVFLWRTWADRWLHPSVRRQSEWPRGGCANLGGCERVVEHVLGTHAWVVLLSAIAILFLVYLGIIP